MVDKKNEVTPWPHQAEFLDAVARLYGSVRHRALFVMATGLGKTNAAAFAYQRYVRQSGRVRLLFLAHQTELLIQARDTFRRIIGPELSTGLYNNEHKEVRATAVFATFQSMREALYGRKRKFGRRAFPPRRFDYIIVDESHHGHAPTYRPVLEYFQPKFMLGMTATPYRGDFKDIREIFGHEIFSLDLEEALTRGLLTPVEYHIMADEIVQQDKLKVQAHLVSIQSLNRVFFARKRDLEIVESIYRKIAHVAEPRIIVFTASIKHAEKFAALIPGALTIHSGLARRERRKRMKLIRSGVARVAITIDQFNEGVDIPEANVLVFLRSTQSKTIFLQQLGRGLRRVPGKKQVVVLDYVANCERLLYLDELRRTLATKATGPHAPREEFSLNWGSVNFDERALRIVELLRKMKLGLSNEVLLEYLRDFYQKHGRAPKSKEFRTSMFLPNIGTYHNRFGGILKAMKLAGLPDSAFTSYQRGQLYSEELSKEELLERMRAFYRTHKRAPVKRDLTYRKNMPTMPTYVAHFGSYRKALSLAGIPVAHSGRYSDRLILKKLREFYQQEGRSPRPPDLTSANGMPGIDTIYDHFGSISRALKLARLPVDVFHAARFETKQLTDEQMVGKLKKFYYEHKRAPTAKDMGVGGKLPHPDTLRSRFGGLKKAFDLAGIPIPTILLGVEIAKGTDEELLQLLREFFQKHRRSPRMTELTVKNGLPGWTVLQRRFGSNIGLAYERAGIPVPTNIGRGLKRWTKDQMLESIRQFYVKHGRVPNQADFRNKYGLPSYTSIYINFGGSRQAIVLAGIPETAIRPTGSQHKKEK